MKIRITPLFLFFISYAFAQPDTPDNLRAKIFELNVKTIPPESLRWPFQSIKIIDCRPDTSKLGFKITGKITVSAKKVFEKILLKPGIQKGIENFYNEYYEKNFTPNGKVLLIAIKKLWINNMPLPQSGFQRKNIDRSSQQDIYAKFEYYLGAANAYVPLKRVDTVFQLTLNSKIGDYAPSDENKLPFFCYALEKMIENDNYERYLPGLEKKKTLTPGEIDKFNAKANNIPILTEPTREGVFLTFDEFKSNQPSIITFSKRKILKRKIYEITDEKGKVIQPYFAYYDGKKLAIAKRLAELSFENIAQDNFGIYKVGNSFQFFETHFLNTSRQTTTVNNQQIPVYFPGNNIFLIPRQIDLDTGEIY